MKHVVIIHITQFNEWSINELTLMPAIYNKASFDVDSLSSVVDESIRHKGRHFIQTCYLVISNHTECQYILERETKYIFLYNNLLHLL